jgi:hypothetical protein
MIILDQSGEESSRFLKKAAQKLLFMLGHGRWRRQCLGPSIKKFFCFFLFTKRSLPLRLLRHASIAQADCV